MRAQSLRAASRCENAKCKACHCRCGGRLHGAARAGEDWKLDDKAERDFFEQLPDDDPHRVRSVEEKKRRAKQRRAAAKAPAGQGSFWPALEG